MTEDVVSRLRERFTVIRAVRFVFLLENKSEDVGEDKMPPALISEENKERGFGDEILAKQYISEELPSLL